MSPIARSVFTVALVLAAAVAVVPGGDVAAASAPTVTVTVDGTAVGDGNTTLIETDPTVGVSVEADRSIRVVSVRIDGTTHRRYTPNATTLDESFEVGLPSGEHALDVVVKTDEVTTHSVTVLKDAERPYVRYTAPFETDRYAPPPRETTVNRSRIALRGTFTDVSGVEHLRLVRTYEYDVGATRRTDRDVYETGDLNGSFEQPVFLGVGRNNVSVWYYDRLGHARKHEFRIVVEDTAPPTLSNLSAVRPSTSKLRIRGEATDNGQIRSVSIHPVEQAGRTYLVPPGNGAADSARQHVGFEENVSLYPAATDVVVNATDTAGNSVERTITVRRTVAPELRLDRARTRYANRSAVVVAGRITDGEAVSATVETVDPTTGEVVDIASVHEGGITTDLAFERRLDPPDGRTVTIRLRVIDSAGTEHVVTLDRTRPVPTAATATSVATASPTPTPTASTRSAAAPSTPTANASAAGPTLPLVGVPLPGPLAASVALPVPVVGPVSVPVVPVALACLLGLGAVARVR